MKKTIKVSELVDQANKSFRDSKNEWREQRRAIQTFVETILHETGNYNGFRYLSEKESHAGHTYGVEWIENEPRFPDDSRIAFYPPRA